MRLLKLKLKNWAGVSARDVEFSDTVTIIEGPNEVGKSTIVDALKLLVNEMDSSNKKEVKAIKPIGEDIGSEVEAEVKTGDFHFVYAKTFNKNRQTRLDILAPTKQQLTGREAHEKALDMLSNTVDLDLWMALLVDQGSSVTPARLQDSEGLTKALDDAAGSTRNNNEDTALYQAIQQEYEKYFTLKTQKPKFDAEIKASGQADAELADAHAALLEVETDADSQMASQKEIQRLREQIPKSKESLQQHEANWNSILSTQQKLEIKKQSLESKQTIQQQVQASSSNRQQLVADINRAQQELEKSTRLITPLRVQLDSITQQLEQKRITITVSNGLAKSARDAFDLAQDDTRYLQQQKQLQHTESRVRELNKIETAMQQALTIRDGIAIDNSGLELLRKADNNLIVAQSRRDFAAASVSLKALAELNLEVDGDSATVKANSRLKRSLESELNILIPGVAQISITPSHSMNDLQQEVESMRSEIDALKQKYSVTDVNQAPAELAKKTSKQAEIDNLKLREKTLLDGASLVELRQSVSSLTRDCESYAQQRKADTTLPESISTANLQLSQTRKGYESAEKQLEQTKSGLDSLQKDHQQKDAQLRQSEQDLAALQSSLSDKRKRLDQEQENESDDELQMRLSNAQQVVENLQADIKELDEKLQTLNPDNIESQLENAQAVLNRLNSGLAEEEERQAVLADRLQRAQADGRYEKFELAERKAQQCAHRLSSTRRRAEAVALLWERINFYRDQARLAYVAPLKQAIERLGTLVFGNSFEITIADDWKLESRTLQGKTLPFNLLSIGAQEQLGIITRLAAAQIVATQGGVPLIIDDALGFSDPAKLETMGNAIAAAGKQCQIIILTCTPGRFTHVGNAKVVKF